MTISYTHPLQQIDFTTYIHILWTSHEIIWTPSSYSTNTIWKTAGVKRIDKDSRPPWCSHVKQQLYSHVPHWAYSNVETVATGTTYPQTGWQGKALSNRALIGWIIHVAGQSDSRSGIQITQNQHIWNLENMQKHVHGETVATRKGQLTSLLHTISRQNKYV